MPVVAATLRALLMRDELADVQRIAEAVVELGALASSEDAHPELVEAVDLLASGMLGCPLREARTQLQVMAEQVIRACLS